MLPGRSEGLESCKVDYSSLSIVFAHLLLSPKSLYGNLQFYYRFTSVLLDPSKVVVQSHYIFVSGHPLVNGHTPHPLPRRARSTTR